LTGNERRMCMSDDLEITYAQGTDVGVVRDHNEDWVTIEDPGDPAMKRKGRLFIVADGMGGYQAGEVASRIAGETVRREYYADPSDDPTARLRNAVQAANREVYGSAQSSTSQTGMGTTVVVTALIDNKAYIASVGDSRAYVVHQGVLSQITQDHSFVGEQIRAGILTKEQARVHPQRNVITRALGSQATVQVDTFVGELAEGDVLVMCTDGLTGHVPEDRIRDVVTQLPPDQAITQLIQMAKDDGGTDNITTIVLRVGPPPFDGDITAPLTGSQDEPTTVMMPQPQAKATLAQPAAPSRRKGGAGVVWLIIGVLIALMVVGAVGVVALSMSGLLRGILENATPTATAPLLQIVPLATAVEATPTTPAPTPTLAPTATLAPTSTHTSTPTQTPTHTPRPLLPVLTSATPSPSASPSATPTEKPTVEGEVQPASATPSPTAGP
jgi:serine/threonine protein phosphatase PrpC/flagellar basal body-associated protein FliL